MQLDGAAQRLAGCEVAQREEGEGIGREIRLRHRDAAAVHHLAVLAVLDRGAIGVVVPAEPGRHHVAMGVERDHRAVAEAVADDEVGHALHPGRGDERRRHLVRLDLEAEAGQQLLGTRRMRPRNRPADCRSGP